MYIPFLKSLYRSKMPGCTVQFPPPPTDAFTDLSPTDGQGLVQGGSGLRKRMRLTVEGRVGVVLEKSKEVKLKDLLRKSERCS